MIPKKIIKIGVNRLDGTGLIIFVGLPCDLGKHGAVDMMKNIYMIDYDGHPLNLVFSYFNKKKGYCVYKENNLLEMNV